MCAGNEDKDKIEVFRMKKLISKLLAMFLLTVVTATYFAGCSADANDGRLSVSSFSYFPNGLCPVKAANSKWGYIDKKDQL